MTRFPITPSHRALRGLALLAFACATLACTREQPLPADAPPPAAAPTAPAEPVAAAPAATIPGTDALSVSETTSAQAGVQPAADAKPALSPREFAGTFAAQGMQVAFVADGTYRVGIESPSAQATVESEGTWSIEGGGKAVLLDPTAKDEGDRRYEVVSPDELRGDGQTLRRQAR